MPKFTDPGYKSALQIHSYDTDCHSCNMHHKRYFLSSGDYGESFSVYGSFEEAKFMDSLQHLCALSDVYRSFNCNDYSARFHRLSDREVYKRRIRMRSVLYKDCVWVLVCGFVVCDPSAHHTGEICCRVQAVSVSRLCYTGAGNAGHIQRVAVMERLQFHSTILLVWNETQSLFDSIFHLNHIYSTGNNICLH